MNQSGGLQVETRLIAAYVLIVLMITWVELSANVLVRKIKRRKRRLRGARRYY